MRGEFSRMNLYCFDRTFFRSSHSLNPVQLPASMETHLWYVKPSEVKSETLLKQYFDILSPCERENVLRMQGDELRKGALLARALVRTTIARYQINSQIDPRSLKFQKNIHGKPKVRWQENDDWDPPPLHFNISHTSSLVACGVTINSQIGIDVEEKHRRTKQNTLSFARRYFSECEVQFLAAISDPQVQQTEFIKLWTLKEAYVKALGKGFSGAPFKTFTIRFKEDTCTEASDIVVDSVDDVRSWQFSLLELANSHYAAICTEKHAASEGERNIPRKLKVWKTIPNASLEQMRFRQFAASNDSRPVKVMSHTFLVSYNRAKFRWPSTTFIIS